MRVFIDTNLWVYRLDRREPEKSRLVAHWLRELVAEHDIVTSTQVLFSEDFGHGRRFGALGVVNPLAGT